LAASRRLVLASASRSRLSILRTAGFVDEEIDAPEVRCLVKRLAERKAIAAAEHFDEAYVLGCDSMLELAGRAMGKPKSIDEARANWSELAGQTARLMTGHCLLRTPSWDKRVTVVETEVTFGRPTEGELSAYLATGESLLAAGGFTLEGFGAPFVERIRGDALNVMGLSPAELRRLLLATGGSLEQVWPRGHYGTARS
jgi:septum formation protein